MINTKSKDWGFLYLLVIGQKSKEKYVFERRSIITISIGNSGEGVFLRILQKHCKKLILSNPESTFTNQHVGNDSVKLDFYNGSPHKIYCL